MPRLVSSFACQRVLVLLQRHRGVLDTGRGRPGRRFGALDLNFELGGVERRQHVAFLDPLILLDRDRSDDARKLAGDVDLGEGLQRAGGRNLDGEVGDCGRHRGIINPGWRS
ncbi:hypothetical protein ABID25_005314 [Mesorhizobium abyssinicae]